MLSSRQGVARLAAGAMELGSGHRVAQALIKLGPEVWRLGETCPESLAEDRYRLYSALELQARVGGTNPPDEMWELRELVPIMNHPGCSKAGRAAEFIKERSQIYPELAARLADSLLVSPAPLNAESLGLLRDLKPAGLEERLAQRLTSSLGALNGQSLQRASPDPGVEARRQDARALMDHFLRPGSGLDRLRTGQGQPLGTALLEHLLSDPRPPDLFLPNFRAVEDCPEGELFKVSLNDRSFTSSLLDRLGVDYARAGSAEEMTTWGRAALQVLASALHDPHIRDGLLDRLGEECRKPHSEPELARLMDFLNEARCDRLAEAAAARTEPAEVVEGARQAVAAGLEYRQHRPQPSGWHPMRSAELKPLKLSALKDSGTLLVALAEEVSRFPGPPASHQTAVMSGLVLLDHLKEARGPGRAEAILKLRPQLAMDWSHCPSEVAQAAFSLRSSALRYHQAEMDRSQGLPPGGRVDLLQSGVALARAHGLSHHDVPELARSCKRAFPQARGLGERMPADQFLDFMDVASRAIGRERFEDQLEVLDRLHSHYQAQVPPDRLTQTMLEAWQRFDGLVTHGISSALALEAALGESMIGSRLAPQEPGGGATSLGLNETHLTVGGFRLRRHQAAR